MRLGLALVIIDDSDSAHGRRMARVVGADTPVVWLRPTLTLARDLGSIDARVLAAPLRVRGGGATDPFTREIVAALRELRARGCHVFVAQGPHPNPLAAAGTPVPGVPGPRGRTASEACVAAADAAFVANYRREELRHG